MLKQTDLDAALSNHDNEMNLCEERRCDWALLHLVLAYPDICSGLQVSLSESPMFQDEVAVPARLAT